MAQIIGELNCDEITPGHTVGDAESKVYFYTSSVGNSKESAVYLKLNDGSEVLCKLIDDSELGNPVGELVDNSRNSYEIVEDVAVEVINENIDADENETLVLVDGSSAHQGELMCFTENGKRSYVCQFQGCERRFTSRNNLKTHQRNHTGERPFKCDECDTVFNTDYARKVHMRRHTGDKPYQYALSIPSL